MSHSNTREPKPAASNDKPETPAKPFVLKGGFAAGERTLPTSTVVEDFASGEHTLPTPPEDPD